MDRRAFLETVSTRTERLRLLFDISRWPDEGWPWDAKLMLVEPRKTGLRGEPCGSCDEAKPGRRICDACAVEESIAERGPELFLLYADLPIIFDPMPDDARFVRPASVGRIIDREGLLEVTGYMEFFEDDEKFRIESSELVPNPPGASSEG